LTTDDVRGRIKMYVGEGEFTDDPADTMGGVAVLKVPGLQKLLKYLCENGFEHHVAMSRSNSAAVLEEALGKYLGWEVYRHGVKAEARQ
jgi:L-fucose isomerase-like protein